MPSPGLAAAADTGLGLSDELTRTGTRDFATIAFVVPPTSPQIRNSNVQIRGSWPVRRGPQSYSLRDMKFRSLKPTHLSSRGSGLPSSLDCRTSLRLYFLLADRPKTGPCLSVTVGISIRNNVSNEFNLLLVLGENLKKTNENLISLLCLLSMH